MIAFLWGANTIIMVLMWSAVNEILISHGASLEEEYSFFTLGGASRGSPIAVLRVLAVFLADLILVCPLVKHQLFSLTSLNSSGAAGFCMGAI